MATNTPDKFKSLTPDALISQLSRRAINHQYLFWFLLASAAFQTVLAYFTTSLVACLAAGMMGMIAVISLVLSLNAKLRIEIEELRMKADELSRGYSIAESTDQAR